LLRQIFQTIKPSLSTSPNPTTVPSCYWSGYFQLGNKFITISSNFILYWLLVSNSASFFLKVPFLNLIPLFVKCSFVISSLLLNNPHHFLYKLNGIYNTK
jgi:hypothetical protein